MAWFRREPLHARLAREGGLLGGGPEPVDTTPRWGEAGIHGVPRPRRWDAVVSAEAPGLPGDEVRFVALPDGSLLVDEDLAEEALTPIADAVEETLAPPYRAEAVRREGETWAVAARSILTAELPADTPGNELTLTSAGEERVLEVDGLRSFGSVRELERLGGERGDAYVVHATRLDGNVWEVRVDRL